MAATDPNPTPIPPEMLRQAMARVPTAVAVITTTTPAGPAGMTAVAVDSLSLEPPLMLACMDRGSRTLTALRESRRFGINLLTAHQQDLAAGFGSKGDPATKFEGVEWSERDGLPALADSLLWFACELRDLHDGGDHLIATGEVSGIASGEGEPLLFFDGAYRPLGRG